MSNSLFVILFISLFFSGCKFIAKEIKGSFDLINNGFASANEHLSKKMDSLCHVINLQRNINPVLSISGDSICYYTTHTCILIDSLIVSMDHLDPSGTRTDIAESVLLKSKTTLTNNLGSVYYYAYKSIQKVSNKAIIDSLFVETEVLSDANWHKKYFDDCVTMGAIAQLQKFKLNIYQTAIISLSDIEQHMSK